MMYYNVDNPHYAPDGYYDRVETEQRKHKFVGRAAWFNGRLYKCVRASEDLAVFAITPSSEMIVSGDKVNNIRWVTAKPE